MAPAAPATPPVPRSKVGRGVASFAGTPATIMSGRTELLPASLALPGLRANIVMARKLRLEMDMTATQALAFPEQNLVGWERALYAFLVEKERRSGSTPHRPGLLPHAPGLLRASGEGSGQGDRPRSLRLGARSRPFRQGPLPRHHRRPHGLPLLLLPLPHPHGRREQQPLRQAGATENLDAAGPGTLSRRSASTARRHPRHSARAFATGPSSSPWSSPAAVEPRSSA